MWLKRTDQLSFNSKCFTTPEFSSIILSKLSELKRSEKLCDVFISNEESEVSVHSYILSAVSPFMLRYISSQATNCQNCSYQKKLIVPITLITKMMSDSLYNCMECISEIINYIYTGSIRISDDHFDHIVNISCNLEIEQLIAICRNYNCSKISLNETNIFESDNYDSCDVPVYKISRLKQSIDNDSFTDPLSCDKYEDNKKMSLAKSGPSTFGDSNKKTEHIKQRLNSDNVLNQGKINCDSTEKLETTPSKGFLSRTNSVNVTSHEIYSSNDESVSSSEITDMEKVNDISDKYSKIQDATAIESLNDVSSKNKICDRVNGGNVEVRSNNESLNETNFNYSRVNFEDNQSLDKQSDTFPSSKFKCLFCDFRSNSLRCTAKHILEVKHGNKCSICLFDFENNDGLIQHVNEDHYFPPSYTCESCRLSFKTLHSLKNHLITHEGIRERIKCDFCNKMYRNKTEMKLHILKSHNNSEKSCDFCNYKTKFSSYLKRHLLKHNRVVISCSFPHCTFQTVWKSNLKDHMKIHLKIEKEFACDICKKTFSLKKNLQRHVSFMHNKCKDFTCPKCKYKNKRLDKVRAHCLKVHQQSSDLLEQSNKQYLGNSVKDQVLEISDCVSNDVSCVGNVPTIIESHLSKNLKKNKETVNVYLEDVSNSSSDRLVYLNETTGELTFFCDSEGKLLKGVPDVITVHSISGVSNSHNFDASNSSGVILNETTGELTCIQLNFTRATENRTEEKPMYSSPEVTVTVLDEATGEITRKHEQISLENDNNMTDFDSIFDTIDFDAMNDDSFDGFDDFDNDLFNAEFNVGSESPDMDKILNEFTGELFTDDSACQYSLNKQIEQDLWQSNDHIQGESNSHTKSQVEEFTQIFLDEVTGELTADFSPLLN